MLIVGVFQITSELEQLLSLLEQVGMEREQIIAIPMDLDKNDDAANPIRSRDRQAGGFEMGMASATAFGVIGMSRGFILDWGPILWGIISAVCGFVFGFLLHLLLVWIKGSKRGPKPVFLPEVTVLIRCKPDKADQIRKMFWQHQALSVGVVNPQAVPS